MSQKAKAAQQARRTGERLLKMLRETGPRKRTVCVGLVGERVFEALLAARRLRMVNSRRGARYRAAA